jgi:hypothetical protein
MIGDDDRQVEYDRLFHSLDRQKILAFAQHSSSMATMQPGYHGWAAAGRIKHLMIVGELAVRYVELLCASEDRLERRYTSHICEAAGLLHETMRQSCNYEDIVDLADEAVAGIVAAVTPDVRVSRPQRIRLLCNQIGLARREAQVVMLADLRHEYDEYSNPFKVGQLEARLWSDNASVLLSHMRGLVDTPLECRVRKMRARLNELDRSIKNGEFKREKINGHSFQ